jgi:hypothetical protein
VLINGTINVIIIDAVIKGALINVTINDVDARSTCAASCPFP